MKKLPLMILVILALSLCGCQPVAKEETKPSVNVETEFQSTEESIPSTEEEAETESETMSPFSYDRLPEESTKDYFARVIEYEKEGLLAELEAEKESDPVWTDTKDTARFMRQEAKENYPLYNYYHSPSSPYKTGRTPDPADDCLADSIEMVAVMSQAPSIALYAPFDFAVFGVVVMVDDAAVIEVTECYWGIPESGDKLIPLEVTSHNFEERLIEGSEWILFGYEDDSTYRIRANAVYVIEDGFVRSLSLREDFNQYTGLNPEELALTVLRIQTKYGQK